MYPDGRELSISAYDQAYMLGKSGMITVLELSNIEYVSLEVKHGTNTEEISIKTYLENNNIEGIKKWYGLFSKKFRDSVLKQNFPFIADHEDELLAVEGIRLIN